jgi:lysine-specific demethylase 8
MRISQIERIAMPRDDVFYDEVMRPLRPVVITDLFAGQPIRQITTREQAVAAFRDTPITIQDEYGKAYADALAGSRGAAAPRSLTFAEYFDYVDRHRDTRQMSIELPTPPAIRATYTVPSVCQSRANESEVFVNQCFIGNAGNHAQIHFDKAGLHGFLHQVFGRKRITYFPHEAAPKLMPLTQVGGWHLHNFTDADRTAFLEFTGGAEAVLEPGDCYFVPLLSWHAVEYLDDGMSISLRFRRPAAITKLVDALFPDLYLQGIAARLADPKRAEGELALILRRIEQAADRRETDGRVFVARMRKLARELHAELYPDWPKAPYLLDLEEHFPSLLPHFLDANDPARPRYE